jgi:hypothetical protein
VTKLSRRKKLAFRALLVALSLAFVYAGSIVIRTSQLVGTIERKDRGWMDGVMRSDPVLGFAPLENALGERVYPIGSAVPARVDANGLRVPVSGPADATTGPRPHVLALGDSYTWGDGVLAEETFVQRAASTLGGTALNGGVCAYGLAQMVLRARTLIPKLKPDLVVVQYSYWLVDRARLPYAPTFGGKLVAPYYQDGGVIHSPPFDSRILDLPVRELRQDPSLLRGLFTVGFPLYLHDDLHGAAFTVRTALGNLPRPAREEDEVAASAYGELARLARENGARFVIFQLGTGLKDPLARPFLEHLDRVTYVDGLEAMFAPLAKKDEATFNETYEIRREGIRVDTHPNPEAHAILGRALALRLASKQ